MQSHFDLIINTDYPNRTADLCLLDGVGNQLAYRHTDFKTIVVSHRQGLFDLRNYLGLYVEKGQEAASIAANAETQGKVKFGQVFLAAPDVDRDLFLDLAHLYPVHAERTTLYASGSDRPVHLSSKLHDAPRAGYYTPYTVVAGVDTVAVPDFDIDLLGHSYFAQAEALLHDIYDLMRHNQNPAKRQRIEPAVYENIAFWTLRR